jgi:hypothetical protein
MATPHVAGVAVLIASLYPEATPDQIKTRILANVDVLPSLKGKVLTGGRLNAAKALEDDATAPGAPRPGDASASWNAAKLSWTNSGDDGAAGTATFSEVRWTDADGRAVTHRVKAGDLGALSQVELPLFPSSQARMLELEVVQIDNVANVSEPSNVSLSVPAAKVANLEWAAEGQWSQIDLPNRKGVWTDNASGNYADRSNTSLTSKPFRLEGQGSQLSFETRYRVDPTSDDAVEVELREVGGKDWKSLEQLSSFREWHRQSVDLSAYDGKTVELRFRLHSDGSKNEEGVYLDRISVAGA